MRVHTYVIAADAGSAPNYDPPAVTLSVIGQYPTFPPGSIAGIFGPRTVTTTARKIRHDMS